MRAMAWDRGEQKNNTQDGRKLCFPDTAGGRRIDRYSDRERGVQRERERGREGGREGPRWGRDKKGKERKKIRIQRALVGTANSMNMKRNIINRYGIYNGN